MNGKYKKELILINPCSSYLLVNIIQRIATKERLPYSLLTLAALTPKDYHIRIINYKSFWVPRDFVEGALVGITCITSSVDDAYRLADRFRRAGSKVVLGGPHVSALPDEAINHADSIIIGEAESVWPRVIEDFQKSALQKTYKGEPLKDFFTPAYEYFLNMDPSQLKDVGIHIDRGCKYHCDFCSRISSWLRFVSIEQVIELIKRIKIAKAGFFGRPATVGFLCDNIYSSPSYAKELFRKMIPLNVAWAATSSIDIGFDEEALQLAQESGCSVLLIGFETIYPQDYQKTSLQQLHSTEDYKAAIKNIKAHRIKIIGSFILGFDRYRHRDYLRLLWFLIRSGLWRIYVFILTPFPGSELFERLKKESRIVSFDWRRYNLLSCVFRPRHTSIFSVYAWFWVIRILTVLLSPFTLLFLFALILGWQASYKAGDSIFHYFLRYF